MKRMIIRLDIAGEYYDVETGTYYLRARYYNPYIGRFITEDSYRGQANDPLSLNLYTYAQNNPVYYTDPSGHIAVSALLVHLFDTAKETAVDVMLDYLLSGGNFEWGNVAISVVENGVTNFIPIWGEIRTAKKIKKLAKKYGDDVFTYISKHGDDFVEHIDELTDIMKKMALMELLPFYRRDLIP